MQIRVCLIAVIVLATLVSSGGQTPPTGEALKFGVRAQPGPMDSVLLKDYAPSPPWLCPRPR